MFKTQTFVHGEPGFIAPGSEEHAQYISPSKVASICGVSRWESAYTLWHRMKNLIPPKSHVDIFDTGIAMELAMAELWKLRNPGWRVSRGEVQYVTDEFDFPALATIDRRVSKGRAKHILEMKIARDLEGWGDPDLSGDAPADYVLQVICQQLFTGLRAPANLMVLGPFFTERVYTVDFDVDVSNWVIHECTKFYKSLSGSHAPELDDSVSTYRTVRQLHTSINGSVVEIPEELATEVDSLRRQIEPLESRLRGCRSQLLELMGDAQYAEVNGERIARRQPNRSGGVSLVMV